MKQSKISRLLKLFLLIPLLVNFKLAASDDSTSYSEDDSLEEAIFLTTNGCLDEVDYNRLQDYVTSNPNVSHENVRKLTVLLEQDIDMSAPDQNPFSIFPELETLGIKSANDDYQSQLKLTDILFKFCPKLKVLALMQISTDFSFQNKTPLEYLMVLGGEVISNPFEYCLNLKEITWAPRVFKVSEPLLNPIHYTLIPASPPSDMDLIKNMNLAVKMKPHILEISNLDTGKFYNTKEFYQTLGEFTSTARFKFSGTCLQEKLCEIITALPSSARFVKFSLKNKSSKLDRNEIQKIYNKALEHSPPLRVQFN